MTDQTPMNGAGDMPPPPPPPPPAGQPGYPPPPSGPPRTSRRGLWITLGVLAVVLVAGITTGLVGKASADSAAEDFRDDVVTFEKRVAPDMVDAALTWPEALFPSGDGSTAEALEAQKEACTTVEDALGDLDDIDVPELGGHPFAFLSGTFRDAREESKEWAKKMLAYHADARDHLNGMIADCTFQISYNEVLATAQQQWDELQSYTDKKGESTVIDGIEWTCHSNDGCLPSDRERLDKYVSAYDGYQETTMALRELAGSSACADTSLGADACAALEDVYANAHQVRGTWIGIVGEIGPTPDEAGQKRRDAAFDEMDRAWTRDWAAFSKAVLDRYPKMADEDWVDVDDIWYTQVYWFAADQRYRALTESSPVED